MITSCPMINPSVICIILPGKILTLFLLHFLICCTIIQQLMHLFSQLHTHNVPVTTCVITRYLMSIYPCKHMFGLMHYWMSLYITYAFRNCNAVIVSAHYHSAKPSSDGPHKYRRNIQTLWPVLSSRYITSKAGRP
ncbi:hypothetical protein V1522DRAFT_414219 [Lipomyces starkeyi]